MPDEDIRSMLLLADREQKDPENPVVTQEDFLAIMRKAGILLQ